MNASVTPQIGSNRRTGKNAHRTAKLILHTQKVQKRAFSPLRIHDVRHDTRNVFARHPSLGNSDGPRLRPLTSPARVHARPDTSRGARHSRTDTAASARSAAVPPARLPPTDPAEPCRAFSSVAHVKGRVSLPEKGYPRASSFAPPPHRAMAAADDANVPTPAASEKTPDDATAPAARARSWAEIASAKDEPHRTGPDARAPSATIHEATDDASRPPLGEPSGSAAIALAPPPTPAGLEVVSVSADAVALRWTPVRRGDAAADPSCPTSEERSRGAPAAGDENGASASAPVDDDGRRGTSLRGADERRWAARYLRHRRPKRSNVRLRRDGAPTRQSPPLPSPRSSPSARRD